MKQTYKCSVVAAIAFVVLASVSAHAAEKTSTKLEKSLRAVVEANFSATEAEDLDAGKWTIHTQSPVYIATAQTSQRLFDYYDVKVELVSFRYIGSDGPYAIGRGQQKTAKVSGPAFKNNVVDSVYVFRKEGGKWKLWQQVVLETNFIE